MKTRNLIFLILLMAFGFTACQDKEKERENREEIEQRESEREAQLVAEEERMEMEANSIAAIAMENEDLSALVNALQRADLAKTFTEENGPFTVFAPTNDAFENVGETEMDTLMSSDNKDKLTELLKYHVVEDEVTAEELSRLIEDGEGEHKITTMAGAELTAKMEGDQIMLTDEAGNSFSVIEADVEASNGIVHVIDGVAMKKKA